MLLLVNAGSSSVKLTLMRGGEVLASATLPSSAEGADLERFLSRFAAHDITAVGHRIVHGGELARHARIDDDVLASIRDATPLAPLHNPIALRWVELTRAALGGAPSVEVAVLDTTFFVDMPEVAKRYALPDTLPARRVGFHGLAHASMWRKVQDLAKGAPLRRTVTLQLGAGCSAAALLDGRPQDVSMGFSPGEGLVMASRAGDLDTNLVFHWLRAGLLDTFRLEQLLTEGAGLRGMTGTGDMREVLARAHQGDAQAELALTLYCYRVSKVLGAYAVVLGGLDAVVFGGGVGENAPEVRERILRPLAFFGLTLAASPQTSAQGVCMSAPTSTVSAWAVRVDEAVEMARIVASFTP